MRKIREVLRLSALGLAQHQIARSCSIVQSTVHKYMKLAQAAKLAWPLPEDLSDRKLDELLFGRRTAPAHSPATGFRRRPQGTPEPQGPDLGTALAGIQAGGPRR